MSKKIKGNVATVIAAKIKGLPTLAKYDAHGEPIYKTGMMTGQELNAHGAKDARNREFVPGVTYRVPILQYVNHMEEAQRIYRADGISGVDEYIDEINMRKARLDADAEKMRGENSWWKRILRVLRIIK